MLKLTVEWLRKPEISSCGKVFPAHKDFQSCVAHALSMRESVIDCRRGEVVEYQPVCRAGQCDVEDVAHIASRAYVLTTNFMTDNEFLFYSDLWSVSVPMDIGVEYENGIPEYQNPLPTIVFGFDRSVKVNPAAPGALGDFAGKKWAVDREGRLRIGDRVYRYSAEYRALFNPLPDPSDNLGNFIIRKDLAPYFRRNPF